MLEEVVATLITSKSWGLLAVLGVVQTATYIAKRVLKDRYSGIVRFATIYVSTVVLGSIVLLVSGVDLKEAFAMANWLAQAQVAAHQAYKTSREKKL